jgi:hypothetical protein
MKSVNKILAFLSITLFLLQGTASAQESSIEELQRLHRRDNAPTVSSEKYEITGVPELYEGELDDLGPQFLLLQQARHKYIDFFTDFQVYRTTNATLVSDGRATANVGVYSAELNYIFKPVDIKDGKLDTNVGVRHTSFRYGMFTGSNDKIVSGVTVDALDFEARAAYVNWSYVKGEYIFNPSVTYTSLINAHGDNDNTYYETAPAFSLTKMFPISDTWTNFLTYNFAWREATSETFGDTVSGDFNDRWEHGLSFSTRKFLSEKLILQPAYSWQWTDYRDKTRTRRDVVNGASVNLLYLLTDQVFLRTFMAYDKRNSTDQGADNDYRNFTSGAGASLDYRF